MTTLLFHPLYRPLGPVIRAATDEFASLDAQIMMFVYAVILMLVSSISLYWVWGRNVNSKKIVRS
jgi:iron(III) transport system permease protein